jgi:hypothetical protein
MILQWQMLVELATQYPDGSSQWSRPGILALAFSFESRIGSLKVKSTVDFVWLKGIAVNAQGGSIPPRFVLSILFHHSVSFRSTLLVRPAFPQGLKPTIVFVRLAARLKPCPFKADP